MIADLLAISPLLLMLGGGSLLLIVAFVGIEWPWIACSSRRLRVRVVGWCLRTFTAAGDDCHSCIDCRRWALPVACLSCGRTRVLTATSTIPTDGATAASIATARQVRDAERLRYGIGPDGHPVVSFEDRRTQRARDAFDEIDLDLDDVAVN